MGDPSLWDLLHLWALHHCPTLLNDVELFIKLHAFLHAVVLENVRRERLETTRRVLCPSRPWEANVTLTVTSVRGRHAAWTLNPATIEATLTELSHGAFVLRVDDSAEPAFWLEIQLREGREDKDAIVLTISEGNHPGHGGPATLEGAPPMNDKDDLLPPASYAKEYPISRSTLYSAMQGGSPPYYHLPQRKARRASVSSNGQIVSPGSKAPSRPTPG